MNIRPALFINLKMQTLQLSLLSDESGFKETPVVQLLSNKLLHHTWPHHLLSPFSGSRGKDRCVQSQLSSDHALSASELRAVRSRKSTDTSDLMPRLFWEVRRACQTPASLAAQSTEVTQTIFN